MRDRFDGIGVPVGERGGHCPCCGQDLPTERLKMCAFNNCGWVAVLDGYIATGVPTLPTVRVSVCHRHKTNLMGTV